MNPCPAALKQQVFQLSLHFFTPNLCICLKSNCPLEKRQNPPSLFCSASLFQLDGQQENMSGHEEKAPVPQKRLHLGVRRRPEATAMKKPGKCSH